MDEEKPSEENAELRTDSENTETNDEKETSVDDKEKSVEEENSVSNEDKKEENAEFSDSGEKETINQDSQDVNETNKKESQKDDELTNNEESANESEHQIQEVKKEETPAIPKSKKGKEGSWTPMIIVMGISLVIAFAWDKMDFIKNAVHAVLDPSAGVLLGWNLTIGMLLIVLMINLLTTTIQKYATDQEALRELKKQQKILQAEMKKYKDHPQKVAELSKQQMQFIPKTFKLTSRAIMFTGIPFILFFRWFTDVFTAMEVATGAPVRFLGFLSWFWFYLIFTMAFSMILRKMFKVV